MTWIDNLILSLVEGLTEFLPVSSTGHLIIARHFLGMTASENETFLIAIQFGAILSILVLYWKKFFSIEAKLLYPMLIIGFIPAGIIGFLFNDIVDLMLKAPWITGFTLIVGGVVLIYLERIFPPGNNKIASLKPIDSLKIGLFQCIAMIPGVSRSAATIAGGLHAKLSRSEATEFSFLLALPTLAAAGGYKMLTHWEALSRSDISDIALGNVLSFITAFIAVRFFINFIKEKGFSFFGYYRIVLGSLFLGYWFLLQ